MSAYLPGQVLAFDARDGHPASQIIGIDHYRTRCMDGVIRTWESYTLVAVEEAARDDVYKRWYAVDLPDLGMSFVRAVAEKDLPGDKIIEQTLSGQAEVATEGNGEMGTGKSLLITYWDRAGQMWAEETFADADSTLYFKTNVLKGPVGVVV